MLQVNDRLMLEHDVRVRNALEARTRAADQALQHFVLAMELEQNLRDEE